VNCEAGDGPISISISISNIIRAGELYPGFILVEEVLRSIFRRPWCEKREEIPLSAPFRRSRGLELQQPVAGTEGCRGYLAHLLVDDHGYRERSCLLSVPTFCNLPSQRTSVDTLAPFSRA
jgi:hypothetical protein